MAAIPKIKYIADPEDLVEAIHKCLRGGCHHVDGGGTKQCEKVAEELLAMEPPVIASATEVLGSLKDNKVFINAMAATFAQVWLDGYTSALSGKPLSENPYD